MTSPARPCTHRSGKSQRAFLTHPLARASLIQNLLLVDTLKTYLTRKPSVQLQEIVQASNPDLWSPEAVTAASAILQARMAMDNEGTSTQEEDPTSRSNLDLLNLVGIGLALFS